MRFFDGVVNSLFHDVLPWDDSQSDQLTGVNCSGQFFINVDQDKFSSAGRRPHAPNRHRYMSVVLQGIDQNGGDILSYSIVAGNANDAFEISQHS